MKPGGGRGKGIKWEKEVTYMLREHGFSARRGLQSRDGSDSPDVQADAPYWIECKRGRRPVIMAAMLQAEAASTHVLGRTRLPPVAVCKADNEDATATMWLEDWLDLIELAFPVTDEEFKAMKAKE